MTNDVHPLPASPLMLPCQDAFAILLSAKCPAVTLLGVSTVYGNAPLDNTSYNTRAILKAINREDIPVYVGASKPFCRAPTSAPDIHGETGLDGTTCLPTPTVPAIRGTSAISAMHAALSAEPPKTAWLVATGALTNAALLFAAYPDLADHIAGLAIMGGAVGGGFTDAPMGMVQGEGERFGNWTPWAEFNIYCDPEAAQALFSNSVLAAKTTLAPLDLTHQMLGTKYIQRELLYGFDVETYEDHPSEVRVLFNEILTFFARTYADVFGLVAGPPLHDPLAVAATFAPQLFDDKGGERFSVSVVIDGDHGSDEHLRRGGSQCGRTVAVKLPAGQPGVRIPRALDSIVLWRMLDLCLHSIR